MLKDSKTLYDENTFLDTLINIKELDTQQWADRVINYKPDIVMSKFKDVFLS